MKNSYGWHIDVPEALSNAHEEVERLQKDAKQHSNNTGPGIRARESLARAVEFAIARYREMVAI